MTVAADDVVAESELLFNGRGLDNWVVTNTPPETWQVRDGMLVCTGKPYGEIRTRKMYQNFVFEVEWRHLIPGGNAGIFLWADDIPSKGVPFHRGIEVQVLEHAYGNTRSHTTHGDIFPIHGAQMKPNNGRGGSRAFPTELRGRPAPEWNHYRITCKNGDVQLEVNGKLVTSGRNCSPRKGYLCLESEGGIVHFRNMRIQELPDTPIEQTDIAVANRGYSSLYTGLNLSGWSSSDGIDLTGLKSSNGWEVADWTLKHSGSKTSELATVLTRATGFLLDFRRDSEGSFSQIQLTLGTSAVDLATLPATGSTSGLEQKPGQWNRIECDWSEDVLSLTINGQAVRVEAAIEVDTRPAALTLQARGAVTFANLFVRQNVK
jgi:hypothetical protein